MTTLFSLLARVSLRQYAVVGLAVVLVGLVAAGARWHRSAVTDAKQFVRDSIGTAARNALPTARETVYVKTEATNTVGRATRRAAAAVDTAATAVDVAVAAVPQALRDSVPVVDTLVQRAIELGVKSRALADTTRLLWGAVMTERRAHEQYVTQVEHIYIAVRDSLTVEQRRPKRTWKSNTALTLGGALLGAVLTLITSH